jgi:mono/diheme cytochrome c family protein
VKRWLPFILLIFLAALMSVFMFLVGREDPYRPRTGDPGIVYQEACARCHGASGEGSAILYPGLARNRDNPEEVTAIVREGATFMPAFPNIPDSVLSGLADYVARKGYLKSSQEDL